MPSSADEFFRSSHMAENMDMSTIAEGLRQVFQENAAAMRDGSIPEQVAPKEVSRAIKKQISSLPMSELVFFAHVSVEQRDGGTLFTGTVRLVDSEHEDNSAPTGSTSEDGGLSICLALCFKFSLTSSRLDRYPVLLGAIADACLEPMKMIHSAFPAAFQPRRPAMILFQNSTAIEFLLDDLRQMGIASFATAESALMESAERFGMGTSLLNHATLTQTKFSDPSFRRHLAESLRPIARDPYVSEERVPLGGWIPPSGSGIPVEWFCSPPQRGSRRLPELWGWRTNLERATFNSDVDRLRDIANAHDPQQVREFCESRILLTKAAEKGMLRSCEALLDHCGVSIEGVQDPGTTSLWRHIEREAYDHVKLFGLTTPLHRAAHEGNYEVVKFLLKRGASLTNIDEHSGGTALLLAVSQGYVECVRILCEHGSDLSYRSPFGGEALDISEMMASQGEPHIYTQQRVREILRRYDPRCSHCRAPDPPNRCPCKMERYCNVKCQRARWKAHKGFHKKTVNADKN